MRSTRFPRLLFILCFGILHSSGVAADRTDALREHVEILASDEFMGRETGEEGIRKAEEYIAAEFAEYGLEPVPDEDDFFIEYTLYRQSFDPESTYVSLSIEGETVRGDVGDDFRPFDFSDEATLESEIVFAGYGITAPEYSYDDYENLDVAGKIVLILRHEPGERNPNSAFEGLETTDHSLFSTKATNARDHGAAGMILVTDPLNHSSDEDFSVGGRLRLEAGDRPARQRDDGDEEEAGEKPFLALHISQGLARKMVASTGRSLMEIQSAVDRGAKPDEFDIDIAANLSVKMMENPESITARNVAGYLEGSDPLLNDQWVVVGAHHDHIGGYEGGGDTVFNGADDNASGVSGVLELARSFANAPERPRRSLLFMTFSGEEKGLLGSTALVDQHLIAVDNICFMLNLDMIGRNPDQPMAVIGDGFGTGLREVIEGVNSRTRVDISMYGSSYMGASDHHSFYRYDIPFLFFFTGEHEDYHQLGDHADKLTYDRMTDIVGLAEGIISRVANDDRPPEFIHHLKWMGARIILSEVGGRREAVVAEVQDDSRAMKAGLRKGDIVLAIDGEELARPDDVGKMFRDIDPGTEFDLEVRSGLKNRTLTLRRAKVGFLGIVPRPLDSDLRQMLGLREDEGILVRQVVPDGPASEAGLETGDVLVRIEGQSVGYWNLRPKLTRIGAGETVDVTVVRDGEWLTMSLTLGERPKFN